MPPPKPTWLPENPAPLKLISPPENSAPENPANPWPVWVPENWVRPKLISPAENLARRKLASPAENVERRKSIWAPENPAPSKLTWLPENSAPAKLTLPQLNLAPLKLISPPENPAWEKSPPSNTAPVKSKSRLRQETLALSLRCAAMILITARRTSRVDPDFGWSPGAASSPASGELSLRRCAQSASTQVCRRSGQASASSAIARTPASWMAAFSSPTCAAAAVNRSRYPLSRSSWALALFRTAMDAATRWRR